MTVAVPVGFRLAVDPDTTRVNERTLFGGSPTTAMRLTPAGMVAWSSLRLGPVRTEAEGVLARRLIDAGLAHPRPPVSPSPLSVTVVIPVRDRAQMLDRCLSAVGCEHPVVVVDDASGDPRSVAEVAARHGATLIRLDVNGGPAVARNAGLAVVSSEAVAFLDSDCVPTDGWIEQLLGHLADPLVAAAAPHVVALSPSTAAVSRYTTANGGLDFGDREAGVVPGTRVAYVPAAALVVRRTALVQVARGGTVFDPALRYGEDVDLIWRLHQAGWRIRYEPAAEVAHDEPTTWRQLLRRRFSYGTSAASLFRRHPTATAPLVLHPWPTLTVVAALARRPMLTGVGLAASMMSARRNWQRMDLPSRVTMRRTLTATRQTWLGVGRYSTQFAAPILIATALAPRSSNRRGPTGQRVAAGSLLLGPPLATWLGRRPALGPFRFVLGHVADDIAYGAGVWAGCLRARSVAALRPRFSWSPIQSSPVKKVQT